MKEHAAKTQLLLYFGLAGFIIGVTLLFNPGFQYHDTPFYPKSVVLRLLEKKQQELFPNPPSPDSILMAKSALKKIWRNDDLDNPLPADFKKLQKPIPGDTLRKRLLSLLLYEHLEQERNRVKYLTDTTADSRLFVGSLFTNKEILSKIYEHDDTAALPTVFHFIYNKDTSVAGLSIHAEGDIPLEEKTYPKGSLSFFIKYPDFGTWSLLMIFQFVACFIVIPLTIMAIMDAKTGLDTKYHIGRYYYVRDIAVSSILVMVFAFVIYIFFVKPAQIGDQYFMDGFSVIRWIYIVMANLAAIACFTGFLYTGRILNKMLEEIGTKAKKQRDNLVRQFALTRSMIGGNVAMADPGARTSMGIAGSAETPESKGIAGAKGTTAGSPIHISATDLAMLSHTIADTGTKMAGLKDDYKKVRSHFTIFFFTSAFLLSMVVLQTGALFSAINSLDLMRFLNAAPSHFLFRNDFVYLLGAIYSILLLIFYIPVKINMINLESQIPDMSETGGEGTTLLPAFSNGLKSFSGAFAASSPLLISIIQYIIQTFGGGGK